MSSLSADEIATIKKVSNRCIKLEDAVNRLEDNPDFNLLYDTYTKEEPVRLISILSDPSLTMSKDHEVHRQEIMETLIGISRFGVYIRNVHSMAKRARKELEDLEKALEEDKGESIN